ncbi:LytR/AlgR family response regulator transcription factor [Sphingobacterium chuzhouense]|uniref:Response regulator n=1 Tax=Sphingobacterium chuzhouense TaxID=1742264 RepID=A0ABR7XTR5_9SPHI|nr:response regulator [Sphingobacterium chuzhouense]MBD1422565.1 response regulator [Sphingobacterium chuzhouense]
MRKWIGVIIDDQQSAIDYLLDMLKDVAYVEIVATFVDEQKAKRFLHVNKVDFLILDVELEETNAFRFLTGLSNPKIPTILYTGHEKYEDEGYDRDFVDVLLKPVSQSRLLGALRRIDRGLRDLVPIPEDALENYYEYFQVKGPVRYQREMVWLKNLVYVDMQNGKLCIHLADERVLETNASFKQVMELLPSKWFLECAQSVALNINFYRGMVGGDVVLTTPKPKKSDNANDSDESINEVIPAGHRNVYTDFYALWIVTYYSNQ